MVLFFFSSRRRHTRYIGDWSSDVCSSDLTAAPLRRASTGAGSPRSMSTTACRLLLRWIGRPEAERGPLRERKACPGRPVEEEARVRNAVVAHTGQRGNLGRDLLPDRA